MGYTLKEIKDIRRRAKAARLSGAYLLWQYPNWSLQSICNGIGPEAFPKVLRDFISLLHPTLIPAACIHDIEWYRNGGSPAEFMDSNNRLKVNGCLMARWRYRWFDPRRYVVMHQARRFARLCTLFGWPAWISARKER